MSKVKRTYRLDQNLVDELGRRAQEQGRTVTDVLEEAIRAYGSMPDGGHTTGGAYEVLAEQLQVKDRQIARLLESLQAAQALHAVDRRELAAGANVSGGSDEMPGRSQKTWWERFRSAWRAASEV